MLKNLSIILIPEFEENFTFFRDFLNTEGYETFIYKKSELPEITNADVVIFFIDELSHEDIEYVEKELNDIAVIIIYNRYPTNIAINKLENKITFQHNSELDKLPLLIENAIYKFKLNKHKDTNAGTDFSVQELLSEIWNINLNKTEFDDYLHSSINGVAKFYKADDYDFFVLPKIKVFNSSLINQIEKKYNINRLQKFYPEIEIQEMLTLLNLNQDLILFKKNGNVKTDKTADKNVKEYYSLIAIPIFLNNSLFGGIIFNFQNVNTKINAISKEILFVSKFLSLQMQYILVYNQYESSLDQFTRLINNAVSGIYQSTEKGKIIYANPSFLKIIGYDSLKELKEIDLFTELYNSRSDREKFINKIKKEKAVQNYESILKKKNGEIINIIENSRIVDNEDGDILFEGIIQDITHQINLKEKLNYQTSFSEKIVENASFMIFAFNKAGETIMWNSMAEKITGYQRGELYKDPNIIKNIFLTLESLQDYFDNILKNYNKGKDLKNDEIELTAKDGSKKIIRWSWMINEYLDKTKKQVIGIGIDVTETIRLEEQLYESQKMESIGTLAAGMAYDFTSILNELNIYNSSLKSIVNEKSNEANYVKRIDETIRKASDFTSKLIGLSKKEKRKNVKVDINNCINYVLDILEHTVDENIELEKDVCSLPLIEGDISKIHQALLNIAINANESIADHGKIIFKTEVVITKSDSFLNTVDTDISNYVKITISDNGKGIPEELQQRVFDPFFTTKTQEKSSGLGLSVTYNIIKNHKGYIFLESELGRGSNFYIYLPFVGDPLDSFHSDESKTQEPDETSKIKIGKSKILVVDDEMIIRDLLNDVLLDHKYDIILAKDGLEGLDQYKKHGNTIDLVILDIIMPGMSGNEVFQKIREINPDAKIIITSGYSKQKITEELMASGANGFLPKPFNIDKLLGLIKALVEEN